ncbi:3-hydroxyisobutyrate dehydrogenase-like beta-hydroxyacid dehydrogenase [Paraburkholderia sp. WSM4175]
MRPRSDGRADDRHLLHAGHSVHVWNRTRAKAEALRAEGAHDVDTPRELAARCDAVLLCVADAAAVEQIVFGPAGLLDGGPAVPRGTRWIVDHSSIPPAATRARWRGGWRISPRRAGRRTARRGSAYETGTPMPVASTVQQLLRLDAAMGLADADFSAFIDILQTPRGGSNG